jgi:hypothetical protein
VANVLRGGDAAAEYHWRLSEHRMAKEREKPSGGAPGAEANVETLYSITDAR